MYPFRRAPEAQGEHVIWRSNTTIIPDDVIDPELLAASKQNDAANQPSLPRQPPQPLAERSQSNNVEQTSVYQHLQLDVHQYNPQRNPFSNPFSNSQPNHHISSPPRDGSVYQHPQLDVRQSNPFSTTHANRQIIPHFNSQPNPQLSPRGHSPPRDGRFFFRRPAAESTSLTSHLNSVSQGDAPASPLPGTSHLQQDSSVRANIQSPARSRSQSFSRGFGQGPMEMDDRPFPFQAEADSSPLSSLTATPARPSGPENNDMAMDLDDWEPGREAQVGIPSSSPPRNNATPKRPRKRQQEDLQGREGQYQRPRRYNIDLLLESVTIAPVADMAIDQGVAEGSTGSGAASHVDMESTFHDPSRQRSRSLEEIGSAPRDNILRRFRPGISFPSGVPYSTRYSDYTRPPKNFSRPLGAAQPVPPAEDLAAERGRPLSADGRTRIGNVSGPQTGESSRHGQHLNPQVPGPSTSSSAAPQVDEGYYPPMPSHESYTEGVMQHMRSATPGPSGSASNAPSNPQPATSGHGIAGLLQGALQEASMKEVVEAADTILNQRRGPAQRQHLRTLAPKSPMEIEDTSHQRTQNLQQHTQSDGQAQQQDPTEPQNHRVPFTNMEQFQPILAPAPTTQSPLLISPFPLRIPGTFTPAILSLAIDPPRSLQIGTTDSLRSYLRACGIVPYNDVYPRTLPVPREPFNRTIVVEARYLSVIGLLYPRAEFIVSRIAEGAEEHMEGNKNYNKKLEPNSAMMMEKWHVYKAVRMTGEEMQKLGVCVWSEKGCAEWEPVVEAREVKRVKRTEVVVVDDDEDVDMEEEVSDDTVVARSKARGSGKEGRKENMRQTVEVEDEKECENVEMVDAEEENQTSRKRKGKAKDTQAADKKGKGRQVLQEKDGSGNAAGPSASIASASASAPLRRSTRVQSRQASAAAEETDNNGDEGKDKEAAPLNPKVIITRKLRAIQLDEVAAAVNPSRQIKTPKPRLTTTNKPPSAPETDPRAPYLHEASTHYLITLRQRDWPSGGVARIQCTPQARQTIEYIQECFGIQHPYEVWRHKGYRVWNGDTGEVKRRYIKVMRGYAGDENTEDGMMRLFLDEMDKRMKKKEKRRKEKGKGREGEEESGDGKDMSTLEERKAWKESYKALKRRGKKAVARAKGKRKEGEDMDMDYDKWLAERREEENELQERWFEEREGLVEEEELARKIVEFTMFEYGGGDGLGIGKA